MGLAERPPDTAAAGMASALANSSLGTDTVEEHKLEVEKDVSGLKSAGLEPPGTREAAEDALAHRSQATATQHSGEEEKEEKRGECSVDLGNLTVVDSGSLDSSAALLVSSSQPEAVDACCLTLGTQAVQQLVEQLFALPSTPAKMGRLAQLPKPTTPLPREKPLPTPKPPTKWEKFAQTKGIVKRKRGKLLVDEATGEWRRRHGYKKANDDNDVPILEAKSTDEVGVDAFAEREKGKKAGVQKQEKNRLANLKQAAKTMGATGISKSAAGAPAFSALPSTLALAATSLPLVSAAGLNGAFAKPQMAKRGKASKGEISEAAQLASTATASMGKFDRKLKGAKAPKKTPHARKVLPVAGPRPGKTAGGGESVWGQERQLMQTLADTVISRNDSGQSMDVGKAISMLNKEKATGKRRGRDSDERGNTKKPRTSSKSHFASKKAVAGKSVKGSGRTSKK